MARVEKRVEIHVPVPRAFRFVADYRHALDWMAGFSEFEPISGPSYGLGAKVRASGKFLGIRVSTTLEIVWFVEDDHFVSTSDGLVSSVSTWAFTPTPRGTLVSFTGDYHLHGLPVPLFGDSLLQHEVAALTGQSLANLKRVLESRSSKPTGEVDSR